MKFAEITNLTLVKVAMERLTNRLDDLPALGVLYGPSGYGKTTATIAVANSTQSYYETFAKPQNNSLVLGVSLFQHKHNKIKQNNHTNPTITAHFQAALCPFRQQSAQQALTCLPL